MFWTDLHHYGPSNSALWSGLGANLVKERFFRDTLYILSMGTLGKKEMIIPSLNVSFNTILSTDIYVALEQELCIPSISD